MISAKCLRYVVSMAGADHFLLIVPALNDTVYFCPQYGGDVGPKLALSSGGANRKEFLLVLFLPFRPGLLLRDTAPAERDEACANSVYIMPRGRRITWALMDGESTVGGRCCGDRNGVEKHLLKETCNSWMLYTSAIVM